MLPLPYVGPGGGRFFNPPAPHLELCVVTEGGMDRIRIGNLTVRLPRRHMSLHNVHFGNYSARYADTRSYCLFMDIGAIPDLAWLGQAAFCDVVPVARVERLVSAFTTLAERCLLVSAQRPAYLGGPYAYHPDRDNAADRPALILLQAAFLELIGTAMDEATHGMESRARDESLAVRLALECMASRYAEPGLALADLAAAAHLSLDHFGRVFRAATGATPMRRLRTLRVEQACRLLTQTSLRIGEVAASVGFDDPYHFSRVFHQVAGMGPRQYRARRELPPAT
jgi:AraC-like DNA-binding protein